MAVAAAVVVETLKAVEEAEVLAAAAVMRRAHLLGLVVQPHHQGKEMLAVLGMVLTVLGLLMVLAVVAVKPPLVRLEVLVREVLAVLEKCWC
tara:strand:- start:386 stop:661 length:276 start_codon:yes stop_codon:yes gene_type:complete